MAEVNYLYIAELDDSQVLTALERIEDRAADLASSMEKTFNAISQGTANITAFGSLVKSNSAKAVKGFEAIGNAIRGVEKDLKELIGDLDSLETKRKINVEAAVTQPQATPSKPISGRDQARMAIAETEAFKELEKAEIDLQRVREEGVQSQIANEQKLAQIREEAAKTVLLEEQKTAQIREGAALAAIEAEKKVLTLRLKNEKERIKSAERIEKKRIDAESKIEKVIQSSEERLRKLREQNANKIEQITLNSEEKIRQIREQNTNKIAEIQARSSEKVTQIRERASQKVVELEKKNADQIRLLREKTQQKVGERSEILLLQEEIAIRKEARKSVAQLEKQFIDAAKSISSVNEELTELIAQEGAFTVELSGSNNVLTANQQRIQDLINNNTTLKGITSQLTDTYERFQIQLTQSDFKPQVVDEREINRAKQAFIDTARNVESTRNAIRELINEQGVFNVTLGKSSEELTANEQRVQEIINNNETLKNTVDNLVAIYGELDVRLDSLTFPDSSRLTRDQAKARRIFLATVNSIDGLADSFGHLAHEQGRLTVRVGQTDESLSEQDREIRKLIGSNKALQNIVNILEKEYGQLDFALEETDFREEAREGNIFLRVLAKIHQRTKDIGKSTEDNSKSFALWNNAIRLATDALIDLARRGIEALKSLLRESVQVANEFDVLRIQFNNIFAETLAPGVGFGGLSENQRRQVEQLTEGLFQEVRKQSEKFGIAGAPIAVTLLPQLESIGQLETASETVAQLLQLSEAKGLGKTSEDAIFALSALLAGDPRSLATRFDAPQEIRDAVEEIRRAGGSATEVIQVLNDELNKAGFSVTNLDTVPIVLERIRQVFITELGGLGEQIRKPLLDALKGVLEFLQDNREEISDVFTVLGDTLEKLATLTGETLLDNLDKIDFDKINESLLRIQDLIVLLETGNAGFLNDIQNFFNTDFRNAATFLIGGIKNILTPVRLLADLIVEIVNTVTGNDFKTLSQAFDDWQEAAANLDGSIANAILTFEKLKVIVLSVVKSSIDAFRDFQETLLGAAEAYALLSGDQTITVNLQRNIANANALSERLDESIRDRAETIIETEQAQAENRQRINEELADEPEVADPLAPLPGQGRNELTEAEEEALQELLDKQNEITQKRLEIEKDFIEKTIDLEIEGQRKRIDILTKYNDKRFELLRKLNDKIRDILIKNGEKEEDINRDFLDKQEDAEDDSADKRLEIEKEYLRKLEDLRRQFQFDAQEAIRQNDAIAFLRLRRRLAFDRRTAEIERDRDLEDLEDSEEKKSDALKKERDRQLRDLKTDLKRQLAATKRNYDRQVREAKIAYEQQSRDLETALARQEEDLKISYERRLEEFEVYKTGVLEGEDAKIKAQLEIVANGNEAILNKDSELYRLRQELLDNFLDEFLPKLESINDALNLTVGSNEFNLGDFSSESNAEIPLGGNADSDSQNEGSTHTESIDASRREAFRLAAATGQLTEDMGRRIRQAITIQEIKRIINELLANAPTAGRRLGGPVTPNMMTKVNEFGQGEALLTGFSGRVIPLMDPNNFSLGIPPTIMPQNVTNNNFSNTFDIGGDPSMMSPAQVAFMKQLITESLMQVARGLT